MYPDFQEAVFPLGRVPRMAWQVILAARATDARVPAIEVPDDPDIFEGPLRVRLVWFSRDTPLHHLRPFLALRGWTSEHPFVVAYLSLRHSSLGRQAVLLPDGRLLIFSLSEVVIAPRGVLSSGTNLVTRLRPAL